MIPQWFSLIAVLPIVLCYLYQAWLLADFLAVVHACFGRCRCHWSFYAMMGAMNFSLIFVLDTFTGWFTGWLTTIFLSSIIALIFSLSVILLSLLKIRRCVEAAAQMVENREEDWKFSSDQLYFGQYKSYRGQLVIVCWPARNSVLVRVLQSQLTWKIAPWLSVPRDDLSAPSETEMAALV